MNLAKIQSWAKALGTWIRPYAKAAVSAAGLLLAVASAFAVPGTKTAVAISLTIVVLTIFGVYRVPNGADVKAIVDELQALHTRPAALPTAPGADGLQNQIRAAAQAPPAA